MISGMNYHSFPTSDEVLDDLGPEVVGALVTAVDRMRQDHAAFRNAFPTWQATLSQRTSANLMHDRLWVHFTALVADRAEVSIVDIEPTRQLAFGTRYAVRLKRHGKGRRISSYPTQNCLDVWTNSVTKPALDDLETYSLAFGYEWNSTERQVGDAIISFRTKKDATPLWATTLTLPVGEEALPIVRTPVDIPDLPSINLTPLIAIEEDDAQ